MAQEVTTAPGGVAAAVAQREAQKEQQRLMDTISRMPGSRKAAILLVNLGQDRAAEVFQYLREDEIELLSLEMAKTHEVSAQQSEAVFCEMAEMVLAFDYIAEGGIEFARDVLEKSLGTTRAQEIMNRLSAVIERRPSEFLQRTPPEQVYAFLRDEAPQTVALVLASLDTALAAQVLALLPPDEQAEVSMRIASMKKTSPEVLDEVYGVIREKLQNIGSQEYAATGGVGSLAEILNSADRSTERAVLDLLAEKNAELAEEVRKLLFVFEDIVKLDDRAVQLVLREVDTKDVALALRGVPDEVQQKILTNMSQRGAEMLVEEMQYQPPQKRSVIEEAQGRIVASIRRLEEAGQLVIGRGGEEDEDAVL
jgi:flagellar motor switch protein FliG